MDHPESVADRFIVAASAPRSAHAVTPDVRNRAERAQTEVSEWTPHRSRELLDLLDGGS